MVGMFVLKSGWTDPRNCGELIVPRVIFETPFGITHHRLLVERRARWSVAKHLKVLQHAMSVTVFLLVHLPADTRLLQTLCVRCPRVASRRCYVSQDRTAPCALGIDHAGHPIHSVWPRWPHHRTMISVANRKRL